MIKEEKITQVDLWDRGIVLEKSNKVQAEIDLTLSGLCRVWTEKSLTH